MYTICIEKLSKPVGQYTHKVYVNRNGMKVIEGRFATAATADALAHGMEDVLEHFSSVAEIVLVSEVK